MMRVTAVVVLVLAAFPAAAHAVELPQHPEPGAKSAWTARVLTPVDATKRPGGRATLQRVGRRAPYWGGRNVLLVLDARRVGDVDYVKVLLKRMPAGLAGWVPADDVEVARTTR